MLNTFSGVKMFPKTHFEKRNLFKKNISYYLNSKFKAGAIQYEYVLTEALALEGLLDSLTCPRGRMG